MDMSIRFPKLGFEFGYVGESVRIFGLEITIYGILIAVGALVGMCFVVLEAKRRQENPDSCLEMLLAALVSGVIGARLYYVGFSWDLYREDFFQIFQIRSGGMGFYGGLLGGVIGAGIFCRIKKISFGKMADTASMGLLIGQIIGRWGDFFNRESFGEYTDRLFAMQLPLSAVRPEEVTSLMRENLTVVDGISYVQVHPLFFYESLWCLVLFLFLLASCRHKKFHGEIFMKYLAGYGLGRFFIEGLRTDALKLSGTDLPVAQIISAALFLIFSVMAFGRRAMAKKREAIRRRRREELYEAEEKRAEEENEDWEIPLHMTRTENGDKIEESTEPELPEPNRNEEDSEEQKETESDRAGEAVLQDPLSEESAQSQDPEPGGSFEESGHEL